MKRVLNPCPVCDDNSNVINNGNSIGGRSGKNKNGKISGYDKSRWRCEKCKIDFIVEVTFNSRKKYE